MTCIIGAVCRDGIVIVGDKKVKAGQMTYYEDKIISVEKYENLLFFASVLLMECSHKGSSACAS